MSRNRDHDRFRDSPRPISNRRRTINISPVCDVDKIPRNETGTFLDNKKVPCQFCNTKKRYDRADELKLHYATYHAKLFGPLPNENQNLYITTNDNESGQDKSIIPCTRRTSKRTRSMYSSKYSISDFDPESSESNQEEESTLPKDQDNEETIDIQRQQNSTNIKCGVSGADTVGEGTSGQQGQRNKNVKPSRKKRRRNSKRSKHDNSSSSDTDEDNSSDDEGLTAVLKLSVKLNNKLMKYIRRKRNKKRRNKQTVLYKCNVCSLCFVYKIKFKRHTEKGNHDVDSFSCDVCKMTFEKGSEESHKKMHETQNENVNIKYKIITEVSSGNDSSSDSNYSESTDETLSYKKLQKPGKEVPIAMEAIATISGVKAVNSDNQATSTKTFKPKYQCNDCEVCFLTKKCLKNHLKNSAHYERNGKCKCDKCGNYFSSSRTLAQHKNIHHSDTKNSSQDSSKINRLPPRKQNRVNTKRNLVNFPNIDYRKKTCFKQSGKLLYCCVKCMTYFHCPKTLSSHVYNCGRNKTTTASREQCLKCKFYFTKKSFGFHKAIHERNPKLKREDFKIVNRRPKKNFTRIVEPQIDHVSTTENCITEPNVGSAEVATNSGNPWSFKLKKTSNGDNEKWNIVSNNSKETENIANADSENTEAALLDAVPDNTVLPSTSSHISEFAGQGLDENTTISEAQHEQNDVKVNLPDIDALKNINFFVTYSKRTVFEDSGLQNSLQTEEVHIKQEECDTTNQDDYDLNESIRMKISQSEQIRTEKELDSDRLEEIRVNCDRVKPDKIDYDSDDSQATLLLETIAINPSGNGFSHSQELTDAHNLVSAAHEIVASNSNDSTERAEPHNNKRNGSKNNQQARVDKILPANAGSEREPQNVIVIEDKKIIGQNNNVIEISDDDDQD